MPRFAIIIEYNGAGFHGWQRQPGLRTIQAEIETALSRIANQAIEIQCAGRTDAGVHARYQVAHFDTDKIRPLTAWLQGGNHFLPHDITIRSVHLVPDDFHARFSAVARSYEYWIDNRPTPPALQHQQVTWQPGQLDWQAMQIAAEDLLGQHDFSAFRAAECQAKSPVRTLSQLSIQKQNHYLIFRLTANAFLHHMVRNIMGVLLPIGLGKQPPKWAKYVLESRQRSLAGNTAPAHGLYLCGVNYPEIYSSYLTDKIGI